MTGAGTALSCGAALIALLEQRGVDTVFGIPGVHTLEVYRGLPGSSIRHVTPRHEQGAAFMADAYARVSDRPGVCLLITGAGVTNAATAIASAYHDSRPLLVTSSATDSRFARRGRGTLHDLPDQERFMATITGSTETVRHPEQLPAAVARAFDVLDGPRPRPAHIAIPIDVLALPAAPPERPHGDTPSAGPTWPEPDPHALDLAAGLLARAGRPMILLGGGAMGAGAEALRLSDATGAPIATTGNGKGAVPETHPAAVGATLTLQPVYAELEAADVVLAVGTEFSEVDYYYQPDLPQFGGALIRVDSDPTQVAAARTPAVAIVADARHALTQLATRLDPPLNGAERAAARAEQLRAGLEWWPGAESFFPALDAIAAALPPESIIAADSTQLAYAGNCYLRVTRPHSYLCPAGYGTLGPALPMALGAQLAAPDRAVVCLIGDGGLLFTIGELATAATLGLPVVVIVWDNAGYGEIRESMDRANLPHIGTEASAHDYVTIARGFGCRAERVRTPGELTRAVSAATAAAGPTVVVVSAEIAA